MTKDELFAKNPNELQTVDLKQEVKNIDCTGCHRCARCTNSIYCTCCSDCTNCGDCVGCINCINCTICTNCTNCIGIKNGYGFQYVAYGVQLTKEEYEEFLKKSV